MKYFNFLKTFFIQFVIIFTLFSVIYPTAIYISGLTFKGSDIIMGIVISILMSISMTATKEKDEQTQEFIRSNYWKLKNELNRKINGNKKRNNSK